MGALVVGRLIAVLQRGSLVGSGGGRCRGMITPQNDGQDARTLVSGAILEFDFSFYIVLYNIMGLRETRGKKLSQARIGLQLGHRDEIKKL